MEVGRWERGRRGRWEERGEGEGKGGEIGTEEGGEGRAEEEQQWRGNRMQAGSVMAVIAGTRMCAPLPRPPAHQWVRVSTSNC